MAENIGETVINRDDALDILFGFNPRKTFNPDDLNWHKELDIEFLTLDEIMEQIVEKLGGFPLTITVWQESAFHGEIYLWGNYSDLEWHRHGETRGFA